MANHIANRITLIDSLRRELVGPDPRGEELDCSQPVTFESSEKSFGPWRQKSNGDEILQRDPPTKRYGIGVLYPAQTLDQDEAGADALVTQAAVATAEEAPSSNDDLLSAE